MQKRVIRILMGRGYRESCRGLLKELKILILASKYLFSLLLFVVINRDYFAPNSVYHNFNTKPKKKKTGLHLPHVSLTICQRGVFYSGIKVFNALPTTIKDISGNPKKFKVALKNYLLTHSFYNLDEFFFSINGILYLCYATNYYIVPPVQQKSNGLKFSKPRTRSHVTYGCRHNSSSFW